MAPSEGKRLRSPTWEDFLCRPWQEEKSESSHSSLRAPFLGGGRAASRQFSALHPRQFPAGVFFGRRRAERILSGSGRHGRSEQRAGASTKRRVEKAAMLIHSLCFVFPCEQKRNFSLLGDVCPAENWQRSCSGLGAGAVARLRFGFVQTIPCPVPSCPSAGFLWETKVHQECPSVRWRFLIFKHCNGILLPTSSLRSFFCSLRRVRITNNWG